MNLVSPRNLRLQETLDQLLQLPPEDRLDLGECLLASVAEEDAAVAWDAEVGRRIDEFEAGKGRSYLVREVIAEMRESLDEPD